MKGKKLTPYIVILIATILTGCKDKIDFFESINYYWLTSPSDSVDLSIFANPIVIDGRINTRDNYTNGGLCSVEEKNTLYKKFQIMDNEIYKIKEKGTPYNENIFAKFQKENESFIQIYKRTKDYVTLAETSNSALASAKLKGVASASMKAKYNSLTALLVSERLNVSLSEKYQNCIKQTVCSLEQLKNKKSKQYIQSITYGVMLSVKMKEVKVDMQGKSKDGEISVELDFDSDNLQVSALINGRIVSGKNFDVNTILEKIKDKKILELVDKLEQQTVQYAPIGIQLADVQCDSDYEVSK